MQIKSLINSLAGWFDNNQTIQQDTKNSIDWWRVLPFVLMHLACLSVIWVGWSWIAVVFALLFYVSRMFAITGFYHRYFSHKSFQTNRFMQFLFAVAGATAAQRGPLWWASHHRSHHMHSDQAEDAHSPIQHGFMWSHLGWFLSSHNFATQHERVKELTKFPELRFLDRFDVIVPILFATCIYYVGEWLASVAPSLQTNGLQLLVWGFVISTVLLYHGTFSVNSFAHLWGKRRYKTRDHSRNNFLVAIITMGEGWHNNHHHFPGSAKQGFFWWEIDFTYYGLKIMSWLGLISNLRIVPIGVRDDAKKLYSKH